MTSSMNIHCGRFEPIVNRRHFLQRAGAGFGAVALTDLLNREGLLAAETAPAGPLAPRTSQFPAKAKSGDLAVHGRGAEFGRYVRPQAGAHQTRRPEDADRRLQRQPRPADEVAVPFKQYGESGRVGLREVPERRQARRRLRVHQVVLQRVERPRPGAVPDQHRHRRGPAFPRPGRGSPTAWAARIRTCRVTWCSATTRAIKGGPLNWHAGFLPTTYQGTLFRSEGNPDPQPQPAAATSRARTSGAQLDLLAKLNDEHLQAHPGEAELLGPHPVVRAGLPHADGSDGAGRLLAGNRRPRARCTASTATETKSYGSKCLLARRLVERGVRFVQVYSDGEWDAHSDLTGNHPAIAWRPTCRSTACSPISSDAGCWTPRW